MRWAIAGAIGLMFGQVAGAFVGVLVYGLVESMTSVEAATLVGNIGFQLTTGALIGLLQRLLVRNEIDLPMRWIGFSALGWTAGYVAGALLTIVTSQVFGGLIGSALPWGVIGLGLGLAQVYAARELLRPARWWVTLNGLGWALGSLVAVLGASSALVAGVSPDNSLIALLIPLLTGGVAGALTGLPLGRIARQVAPANVE